MNTETADLGSVAPVSRTGRIGTRETLITLMRREFWEHAALWRVPLAVAALLAISTVFSWRLEVDDKHLRMLDASTRIVVLNMSQSMFALLIYLAASFVVTFFLLDCLYAERKDRTILFWKSLPVSDGLTVLSKFLVAMVVVPLGVFLLAIASHLIALSIWELRAASGGVPDVVSWDTIAWVRGELVILLCIILSSLWYAPAAAAAMLLSAWLKRGPILWAFLGPLLLVLLEGIVFHTFYFWHFIQYRTSGIWHILTTRGGHSVMSDNMRMLSDFNWAAAFSSPDLWLGVLAAAGLLYAAARVRRYRDDT
jgi:ABC-2 type transport system permease protein